MTEQNWYYSYDPDTKVYTGMVLSDEQPEFATSVPISNIINPVWNDSENNWDGDNVQQAFDDIQNSMGNDDSQSPTSMLNKLSENLDAFQKTTLASITSVTTTVADLQKKVSDLEKKAGE